MQDDNELIKVKWQKRIEKLGKIGEFIKLFIYWYKKQLFKITIRPYGEDLLGIIPKKVAEQNLTKKQCEYVEKQIKNKLNLETYRKVLFSKWLEKQGIKLKKEDRITGEYTFFYCIPLVLERIVKYQKNVMEQQDVHLLINEANEKYLELIRELAKKMKMIHIITDNRNQFLKLEEELIEEGIQIVIRNHKKKSLKDAKIIINLDFLDEQLEFYQINRDAIFIQNKQEKQLQKKLANGVVIKSINISIKKQWLDQKRVYGKIGTFDNLLLYETEIDKENNYRKIRERMKKDEICVVEIIGTRGKMNKEEFVTK